MIGCAIEKSGLYQFTHFESDVHCCQVVQDYTSSRHQIKLLHQRLGHPSFSYLQHLFPHLFRSSDNLCVKFANLLNTLEILSLCIIIMSLDLLLLFIVTCGVPHELHPFLINGGLFHLLTIILVFVGFFCYVINLKLPPIFANFTTWFSLNLILEFKCFELIMELNISTHP